jgi:hypothetical protein
LNQSDTNNVILSADIEEAPYADLDVYDDCDVPLDVVSDVLDPRRSTVAANFSVDENGGISRSGSAEDPEADSESDLESDLDVNAESDVEPVVLGRGQRKKTVSKRYQGPIWEEH